ncbi:MAG: hypothetical protein ABFS35_22525 [Bacteroidota bacterium]
MIVGTYVNNNYNEKPFYVEIPYNIDTLRLFDNNRFTSQFWGKGTYELFYSFKGTQINIKYKYEFGDAVSSNNIKRYFFGKPKIILVKDLSYYYEKIK